MWNSSGVVSTERSEPTTIEENSAIGREAEDPQGVLEPIDLVGEPSHLRPTAVLPARPSSSWRDKTVFQEHVVGGDGSSFDMAEGRGGSEKHKKGDSVTYLRPEEVSEGRRTTSLYVDLLLKGSFDPSPRRSAEKNSREPGSGSGILLTPSSKRKEEDGFDLSTVKGWREAQKVTSKPTEAMDKMATTTTSAVTSVHSISEQSTSEHSTSEQSTVPTTTKLTSVVSTARERSTTSASIQSTFRHKNHKFLEPVFLFTTSSPRQTKQLELTTTTEEEQVDSEERNGHSVPSHFFQLEDYPSGSSYPEESNFTEVRNYLDDRNIPVGQSDNQSEYVEEENAAVRETWLYNVNNTSEEVTHMSKSDKEAATNTSVPRNGTSNELERTPRDSAGEHESLEGPYKRLQAQYGSWQNSAVQSKRTSQVLFVIFLLRESLL